MMMPNRLISLIVIPSSQSTKNIPSSENGMPSATQNDMRRLKKIPSRTSTSASPIRPFVVINDRRSSSSSVSLMNVSTFTNPAYLVSYSVASRSVICVISITSSFMLYMTLNMTERRPLNSE